MKLTYKNFPLLQASKSASKANLNLERHQTESPQLCGPTYDRDPIIRPDTPRPHRYADSHPDPYQSPITPSQRGRSTHPYSLRPTPYGGRPPRFARRYEDEDDTEVGNSGGHPKRQKDGSKTILERATLGLLKFRDSVNHSRRKLPYPPRSKALRSSLTERAKDGMIIDHHSLTQPEDKNNHNVSLVAYILLPPLISS